MKCHDDITGSRLRFTLGLLLPTNIARMSFTAVWWLAFCDNGDHNTCQTFLLGRAKSPAWSFYGVAKGDFPHEPPACCTQEDRGRPESPRQPTQMCGDSQYGLPYF
jgi:hypothetical protein